MCSGIAKDFEVVDTPRRVIILEDARDSEPSTYADEDWERIYDESDGETQYKKYRTYSAVLRGG